MRVWGWVLAFVIVVAIGGAAYYVVTQSAPLPHGPTVSNSVAGQPAMKRAMRTFNDSYHRHRHQFQGVSDYSRGLRTNRLVEIGGFLVFVLLTLPKTARGVGAFYRQMMEKEPLPASTGADDANNRRARKVLFFYLLFLLYQLVQFPLTWGRDNAVQFLSDLGIQTVLLVIVAWSFGSLKHGLREQFDTDPGRREKMRSWLGQKVEGLNIRWGDLRRMAMGIFIAAFTPALLAQLTPWLDALTSFNQRMIGP